MLVLSGKIVAGSLVSCKCQPKVNESSFPMIWWMNHQPIGKAALASVK